MTNYSLTSTKMLKASKKTKSTAILDKDMDSSNWDENSTPSVRIKWNGYAFNEIKLPNGKNIVIDPYYHNVDNKYILDKTKTAADIVDGCDYVLFTHTHFDHSQDFPYILKKYPRVPVVMPEAAISSFNYTYEIMSLNYNVQGVSNNDKLEFPDFTLETFFGKHTTRNYITEDPKTVPLYFGKDGKFDPLKLDFFETGTIILNYKITTKEGFTILIYGGQIPSDFRKYNYIGTNPDLMFYQMAANNLGDGSKLNIGNRENPVATMLGDFIASVNPKMALPYHQEKFSMNTLYSISKQCAKRANLKGTTTGFIAPETHKWYRFSKDSYGNINVTSVKK
ncbi:MBL fold metallo-hydrolase [Clostridium ljungdahlii]|uniref:Metallo-beta-lactamase/flavodoxin domain-containing protein n=1 Tax=Clostridium ljungdahlii TaxID=1538 RepID=A0A162N9T7_9CLOT|nr:MBL fold metallo-hydrolase [Clostridium ljungdahlii]OAA90729.1 metallo-beta-lactamase/flavodoxin domain-containing protein [Clostridium ljungdahlii]